jgi:hypothetical protein
VGTQGDDKTATAYSVEPSVRNIERPRLHAVGRARRRHTRRVPPPRPAAAATTTTMASATQAKHEAPRLPRGVGCAQLDASDHGEIYRAALEHRPLFRLSLRMRTAADEPVYFQQESGGKFGQGHTLRLLQQQEYKLRLEISDIGRTLTALESVTIDQDPLAIEDRKLDFSERTNNHVFALSGCWRPTHQSPTRNGPDRQTFPFLLQMKVYAKPAKVTKGKQLGVITCRCDASKQDERWTFSEARPGNENSDFLRDAAVGRVK